MTGEPIAGAFITCVAGDGDPYVKTQFATLGEAHAFHDTLLDLCGGGVVSTALRRAIASAGSFAALARIVGVSDELVRQCATGQRATTGKLLKHLGFKRVEAFVRVGKE